MKTHCAWHQAYPGTIKDPATSGICRRCELLIMSEAGMATPAELEELYQLLEPRVVAWGKVADILTWALIVLACMWFWFAVSAWAMRGFEVVGR